MQKLKAGNEGMWICTKYNIRNNIEKKKWCNLVQANKLLN